MPLRHRPSTRRHTISAWRRPLWPPEPHRSSLHETQCGSDLRTPLARKAARERSGRRCLPGQCQTQKATVSGNAIGAATTKGLTTEKAVSPGVRIIQAGLSADVGQIVIDTVESFRESPVRGRPCATGRHAGVDRPQTGLGSSESGVPTRPIRTRHTSGPSSR